MKKLTEEQALELLLKDIKDRKKLQNPENKWILHSIYVGEAAKRIAKGLGINLDKAITYGYIHDIGRRIDHKNHTIEGYNYLNKLEYTEEARYCLTHSFIDNDINKTAGGGPTDLENYNFINEYLQNHHHNIYDNIIQLCDLFCLESGFTTIENRLLDITLRKGVYDNSYDHYKAVLDLKKRIEKGLNHSLYTLFPEIKQEDLENIESDKEELEKLLKTNIKTYKLKKNI